jgi:hypothetical protein
LDGSHDISPDLTIRERRKMARTEATVDRVYPGGAAWGG